MHHCTKYVSIKLHSESKLRKEKLAERTALSSVAGAFLD